MITTMRKETRKVTTDVLVVGGGTAGFAAAIAASRNGAKVILVEQRDYLGGTMTGGMVNMIRSMRHMEGSKDIADKNLKKARYESNFSHEQLVKSIAQEFVDRMLDKGGAWGVRGQATTRQMFDPEEAKLVMEQMVTEAGVDIWYYAQATEVLKSGNSVRGVVIENLKERIEVEAKITIDATGDGDVCANAGAQFEKGHPEDQNHQPITLYYTINNVNFEKVMKFLRVNEETIGKDYVDALEKLWHEGKPLTLTPFREKIKEALDKGDYPIPFGVENVTIKTLSYNIRPQMKGGKIRYDFCAVNSDMAYNVDATDFRVLGKAMISMRAYAYKMVEFYKKYFPGFEECYLVYAAPMVGIRDTRRVVGDYWLTHDDVLSGKIFEDGIARYGSVVDIHDKDGGKKAQMLTEIGGQGWFHIPYRITLPKGIDNLLVSGRCVSADYYAQGCTRSEAACILTGQAAGTAAAMSIKAGIRPRDVNIAALQKTLKEQDQII